MLTNMTAIENAIKNNKDIVGAFPRWISLGQVSNPKNASMGETGAFIAYGVRKSINYKNRINEERGI